MQLQFSRGHLAFALGASLLMAGCRNAPTEVAGGEGVVALTIRADLATANVSAVVVEVTGPGIEVPIVANLTVSAGIASGVVEVLAGSARVFTLRAFNEQGIETHRGTRTVNIAPDQNASLAVSLTPLTGGATIDARLGTFVISISPGDAQVVAGQSLQFGATVVGADGSPIPEAVVTWASTNPGLVSVDAAGLAQALNPGSTIVVASYRGFAGSASITVTP